ncbi:MAG: hypothetical protein EHM35_19300, partial [Planctomycetaceae bacterium]
ITDAATSVVGTPSVKVDSVSYTPAVTHPSAGVTHFEVNPIPPATVWSSGTHTIDLSFQDSGGATRTNRYTFSVIPQLSTNLWTALQSGLSPGFRMIGHQNPNTNIQNGFDNCIQMANLIAEGFYPDDVSDRSVFTNSGEAWISGVLNYAQANTGLTNGAGNFQSPTYPDARMPGFGLWTPPAGGPAAMDNEAAVFRTFLEFPSAGVYTMGVNSDDGFRVTFGDRMAPGVGQVFVLAPPSVQGDKNALATQNYANDDHGRFGARFFGGSLGTFAQAVLCNPILVDTPLVNAAALNGKIAICQRGGVTFVAKAKACQDAGAVACIIVNNGPADPGVLGGEDNTITIPVIFMSKAHGDPLLATGTTGADSPLILRVGDDASVTLGEYQGGKGSSDVIFQFYVPQAGIYPFRLMWENGGGDANLEWFTISDTGVRTLINDSASPVKGWIQRTVPAAAQINKPIVANGLVTISWTGQGELEMATSAAGPWVKAPLQTNPQTLPMIPMLNMFYRVRSF